MSSKSLNCPVSRAGLILLLIFSLFPFYIAVSASLKGPAQLFTDPLGLPEKLHFENYIGAWQQGNLGRALRNSCILTLGAVLGVLLTGAPAAYALAKIKIPGGPFLIGYVFFCTTIPVYLFLAPLYLMFARLGFIDSLGGMILIYIARWSPFAILLLRSYFVQLPNELLEAALIDGASKWQAFWRVILPVARPGIVTVLIIVALYSWNEFLLPLAFLNEPELQPITVAVAMFQGQWTTEWGRIMASAILGALPILVLFAVLHRRLVSGLAATGIKG